MSDHNKGKANTKKSDELKDFSNSDNESKLKIIGLTGGIASGKSSVSAILQQEGCRIIDCDKIAREIVGKGMPALNEITEIFGRDILNPNGELDRKRLAGIVFKDKDKLRILNSITHKYVVMEIERAIQEEKEQHRHKVVVVDAPLPIERGFLDIVEEVWVVMSDIKERLERIKERDGISEKEAMERISSQKSDEEYLKIADKVIYNNNGKKELEEEVKKLVKVFW